MMGWCLCWRASPITSPMSRASPISSPSKVGLSPPDGVILAWRVVVTQLSAGEAVATQGDWLNVALALVLAGVSHHVTSVPGRPPSRRRRKLGSHHLMA